MYNGRMRKLALASLLGLLAAGCAGLSDLAHSAFSEPRLTFRSATVQAVDLDGATVAFLFDLTNPNAIGVTLARGGWLLELDGKRAAAGDLPAGLSIPANGTTPISFPVRIRFRDVPGIVSLLASGKADVPYRISGTLGVQTPIGILDVPLSHSDRLRLPRLGQL